MKMLAQMTLAAMTAFVMTPAHATVTTTKCDVVNVEMQGSANLSTESKINLMAGSSGIHSLTAGELNFWDGREVYGMETGRHAYKFVEGSQIAYLVLENDSSGVVTVENERTGETELKASVKCQ